jgi:hypothetical protein
MARLISFCGSTGKNTGGIDCDVRLQNPRMMFVGGAKITTAEQATEITLKAAIQDRIRRENGDPEKLYPFPVINTVTNNTEQPTEETLGDGTKRQLREGRPSYLLESGFVGLNQEAAMLEFNGATVPVMMLDDSGKLVGKHDDDGNLIGAKAQISTSAAGFGTYAAGTTTKTSVSYLDSRALSSNAKLFDTAFDTDDFEGLLDVTLETLVAPTGNAHKIGAFIENRSIGQDKNLYDLYEDELAVVGAWRGYTAAGAEVAPSTVVKDAALKGWTVTFGVAVATINLATPEDLDALDVVGVEGIALAV